MEITGNQFIPAQRARVWDALNDPAILKACLPGCQSVERSGVNDFKVVVAAAIGPLRARFNGGLKITEAQAPESCVLVFEGQGGAIGFGKGLSTVALRETAEGTELTYSANAQVGGKLAQVGSRLIDSVAKKMSDDFFTEFRKQLAPQAAPAEVPATAPIAVSPAGLPAASPPALSKEDSVGTTAVEMRQPAMVSSSGTGTDSGLTSVSATQAPTSIAPAAGYQVPAWWLFVALFLGSATTLAGAILLH